MEIGISYENISEKKVEICNISFDNQQFLGIKEVKSSFDFDMIKPDDNLFILPGEEKTFSFIYDIDTSNSDFNLNQIILPYVTYQVDGIYKSMPALHQPVTYEGNFIKEYFDELQDIVS